MSFSDKVNEEAARVEKYGDWLKIKEGDNVIRILVEPEVFYEKYKVGICYTECGYTGSPKYLAWVWDKSDEKIKLFRLNLTIAKSIAAFMLDEDYKFSGFPMPYNIKIVAKNAGTKEVEYTVLPGKPSEIDSSILNQLSTKKTPEKIIESMKKKQKENVDSGKVVIEDEEEKPMENRKVKNDPLDRIDYPDEDINAEDIPF